MKKLRIIAIFMTVSILLTSASAIAAAPGSSTDPLISKSYIDGTYSSEIMSLPLSELSNSMTVLRYKLNQIKINGTGIKTHSMTVGNTVTVKSGSELSFISGDLRLTASNGTVIDVTDGKIVPPGQNLKTTHHYISSANTSATYAVLRNSKISLRGDTNIEGVSGIQFADVKDGDWYYDAVYYSVQKGLINGRTPTSFNPIGYTTVAETIKLASCIHQLYHTDKVNLQNGSPWYSTYVNYALSNGIISKTYSNYDAKITRDEFVHIFFGALPTSEYQSINSVANDAIPDIKTDTKYADEIYTFYRCGMLTGVDDLGTFNPNNNIKRCEVAAIVMRMLEAETRETITLY